MFWFSLLYLSFVYPSSLLHDVGLGIWNQQEWKHIYSMYLSYALNLEGVLAYAIICRQGTIAFGDKIYFTSNVIQTTLQTLRDSR